MNDISVFVDNTNIFLGAQWIDRKHHPNIRINVEDLTEVIEHDRHFRNLDVEVAGTNETLWKEWMDAGYKPHIGMYYKHARNDLTTLQDRISFALDHETPHTLVLVTGDGVLDEKFSFISRVRKAVSLGWKVEVWSWRSSLSTRYDELELGSVLKLVYLDKHRAQITYER